MTLSSEFCFQHNRLFPAFHTGLFIFNPARLSPECSGFGQARPTELLQPFGRAFGLGDCRFYVNSSVSGEFYDNVAPDGAFDFFDVDATAEDPGLRNTGWKPVIL
ncbi:MAG: hypothetical protein ACOC10_10965 [Bacteroidota bacterium]